MFYVLAARRHQVTHVEAIVGRAVMGSTRPGNHCGRGSVRGWHHAQQSYRGTDVRWKGDMNYICLTGLKTGWGTSLYIQESSFSQIFAIKVAGFWGASYSPRHQFFVGSFLKQRQAPAPDVVQRPLAHAEIEMQLPQIPIQMIYPLVICFKHDLLENPSYSSGDGERVP